MPHVQTMVIIWFRLKGRPESVNITMPIVIMMWFGMLTVLPPGRAFMLSVKKCFIYQLENVVIMANNQQFWRGQFAFNNLLSRQQE